MRGIQKSGLLRDLMRHAAGKYINNNDARDNQSHAKQCRAIERLAEPDPADQRDQDDADARPYCVRNTSGHRSQAERQKVKGRGVSRNGDD